MASTCALMCVCVCLRQLADLQLIPDKCNKELEELTEQLDSLSSDKAKEEQHLQEVMDSFKSETQVSHHRFSLTTRLQPVETANSRGLLINTCDFNPLNLS